MVLLSLIALLALSTMPGVTAPPADGSRISLRTIPLCSKLGSNPEDKICSSTYANGTSPHSFPERRQHELPELTEPIKGEWAGGNMTEFCIRDGPKPKLEDVKRLCEKIDDSQIVARTKLKKDKEKDGNCFCKKFNEGIAWFKVCNCDRCDRLEILSGLKEMCKNITEMCASKWFSSGYIQLNEKNGLLVQHNVEPANAKPGNFDPDPVKSHPDFTKSTCNSKEEHKKNQEYTGPVVSCWRSWKALWMAHKCHDNSEDGSKCQSPDFWRNKGIQQISEWKNELLCSSPMVNSSLCQKCNPSSQ